LLSLEDYEWAFIAAQLSAMANDISGWGEQWGEQEPQLTAGAFLSQAQRAHGLLLGESESSPLPQLRC
jgi:hypothetical protein